MTSMNTDFGKTNVTSKEIRSQIDIDKAISILQDCQVDKPEKKVEDYTEQITEKINLLPEKGRQFPWRSTESLWRIYISEILLQRTHGKSVANIYDNFFEKFSNPRKIYAAEEKEIKKEVNSLGFQNKRTRTLIEVGEMLAENNFHVPKNSKELSKPWRVGKYAANATLLFGFNCSVELVDSNVAAAAENILDYPLSTAPHKDEEFRELMKSLTPSDPETARAFYFAFIDFDFKS